MFSYTDWYRDNKRKLSLKRKVKYKKDKDYRDTIKKQALHYYNVYKKSDHIVDRHVLDLGEGKKLFTIGRLAFLIKRDIETIRDYHKKKIIPTPTYFDTRGWRLYSPEQAAVIQLVFQKWDRKEIKSLREVKKEILAKWRKR